MTFSRVKPSLGPAMTRLVTTVSAQLTKEGERRQQRREACESAANCLDVTRWVRVASHPPSHSLSPLLRRALLKMFFFVAVRAGGRRSDENVFLFFPLVVGGCVLGWGRGVCDVWGAPRVLTASLLRQAHSNGELSGTSSLSSTATSARMPKSCVMTPLMRNEALVVCP